MNKSIILVSAVSLLVVGCATPTVVETVKAGDASLTCEQIKVEIAEANTFEKQARGERKVTGTNVAAAVLFWPALIATYSNTEDAIEAARERRERMTKLANAKRCPASVMNEDIAPAPATTTVASKNDKAKQEKNTVRSSGMTFADVVQTNANRVQSCKATGGKVVKISKAWTDGNKLIVNSVADAADSDVYQMKTPPTTAELKSLQGKQTCVTFG